MKKIKNKNNNASDFSHVGKKKKNSEQVCLISQGSTAVMKKNNIPVKDLHSTYHPSTEG